MISIINSLHKLAEELHNYAFDLLLEENPEFKEYFEKSDEINFAISEDDFYACENPMVRKIFDLSTNLESLKDEVNDLFPNIKINLSGISGNRSMTDKLFKIHLNNHNKIFVIAKDFKKAILKAESELNIGSTFDHALFAEDPFEPNPLTEIENIELLTKNIVI